MYPEGGGGIHPDTAASDQTASTSGSTYSKLRILLSLTALAPKQKGQKRGWESSEERLVEFFVGPAMKVGGGRSAE